MSARIWDPESTSRSTTPLLSRLTSDFEEIMHKPVLVVTTHFMDGIEARIDRDYDARRNPHERLFTRDELIEASSGADALFITPLDRLDSEFFKRVPATVKVIATYSVGLDHIDLQAAANRAIAIAYTPGITARMPPPTSRCC